MSVDRNSWSSSSSDEYNELMAVSIERYTSQKQTNYADVEYFGKFFPLNAVMSLLGENIVNRQFSFAFKNNRGIFWDTYQVFTDIKDLKQFLVERKPIRMDVGGIGELPPHLWRQKQRLRRQAPLERQYRPIVQKELVIDVDLKDVTLRTCQCVHVTDQNVCSNCKLPFRNFTQFNEKGVCECKWENFSNKLCQSCWNFAQLYVVILDYCLRNLWGFRNFEFVFSGGKGFHCWILDQQAKKFTMSERKEFVDSFQPWSNPAVRTILKDERHFIDPVFGADFQSFILPLFMEKIVTSGVFDITHIATKTLIFNLYPIDESNERLTTAFMMCIEECLQKQTATEVWSTLMSFTFKEYEVFEATLIQRKLVYSYVFPVIDENITVKSEHLIKIPFSLHPNTGFISVPLSAAEFYTFKPDQAPFVEFPDDVARCGDNFYAFRSLANVDFTKFLICKHSPLLTLSGTKFERLESHEIIQQLTNYFKQHLTLTTVFPSEGIYRVHCRACSTCDSSIITYRENTLANALNRLPWFDGMFHPTLDIQVRYAAFTVLQSIGLFGQVDWTNRINAIL